MSWIECEEVGLLAMALLFGHALGRCRFPTAKLARSFGTFAANVSADTSGRMYTAGEDDTVSFGRSQDLCIGLPLSFLKASLFV